MKYLFVFSFIFLSASGCQSNSGNASTENQAQAVAEEVPQEEVTPVWDTWEDVGDISGPMTITGSAASPNLNGQWVYLYETEGAENYKLDSSKITNGNFNFEGEFAIGIYRIGTDAKLTSDIILNPNEKSIQIDARNPKLNAGVRVSNSQDNDVWTQYVRDEAKFQGQLKSLRSQRSQSTDKVGFENKIYAKDDERTASHFALAEQNRGTFSAKILHRIKSPESRNKGKYWDDIDFTDHSYIRSSLISDRIQDFMRNHSGGTEDGFLNCVDLLMIKAKADEKMFEYTLYTVLEGFYSSGMDNICNYILSDYFYGDACGDIELSDYSLVKASRIKNLQLGNTPPDFSMTTIKGKKYTLADEVKKNNYTLVFFWSSWCHTCEGEIPMLENIYKQYNAKGFDVVGVSVDTDRGAWTNAVSSRNLPWPNVSQLKGWESPVAKDYRVSKTPNMFLLDKDMKIVLKPSTASQISQYLQSQNL